ncbi:MAG: hypothetical protein PHU04_01510 [Candidatus Peribacteraceae bacterium]|nr:hypothetical protein [Candidatus Peribacteraceae bacterium]
MPESPSQLSHPEAAKDPLRASKELLTQASGALRSVVSQFGVDWPRLAAAFPHEGLTENHSTLTAYEPPAEDAHEGVSLKLVMQKEESAFLCSVERGCTRCGDEAGTERTHVFKSGITLEQCAGLAIDFTDESGDAEAVQWGKLHAYRRQQRALLEQEAAAIYANIHPVQTLMEQMKQEFASAIPIPGFGRIMGQKTLHPKKGGAPTIDASLEPRINPSLIARKALEQMLQSHANALQAAAAILEKNLGTLQARIAELQKQEPAAMQVPAENVPDAPALQTKQEYA